MKKDTNVKQLQVFFCLKIFADRTNFLFLLETVAVNLKISTINLTSSTMISLNSVGYSVHYIT